MGKKMVLAHGHRMESAPRAEPTAGSDAVGVAWIDPAEPPELAFPTDRALFERLVRGR